MTQSNRAEPPHRMEYSMLSRAGHPSRSSPLQRGCDPPPLPYMSRRVLETAKDRCYACQNDHLFRCDPVLPVTRNDRGCSLISKRSVTRGLADLHDLSVRHGAGGMIALSLAGGITSNKASHAIVEVRTLERRCRSLKQPTTSTSECPFDSSPLE